MCMYGATHENTSSVSSLVFRPFLVPLEVFFFLLRCNQAAFMEFVDELQFPRIEKVLQLKATLLRNLKHDREVLRETNVNKLDGNNIANAIEASNGSQNLRQSSVNVSKISANSMEEPVQKKSLVAPAPASSIFAGVATRARALLNNHNEENIINRLTRVMSDYPAVRKEEVKGRRPLRLKKL